MMLSPTCLLSIIIIIVIILPFSVAMQIARPWATQHWCHSVINPQWPTAYSKYHDQIEETKGRVSTNKQDIRHECNTRGVQSKCHICEDIVCGPDNNNKNQICHFQLQGVSWEDMSVNIPTVSDVPWAVNGLHRYDFGGESTSHVCMYLSGVAPCQSNFGTDYSQCEVRCWGWGEEMSGMNSTPAYVTTMMMDDVGEELDVVDGIWPNHRLDSLQGVNSTPWELPMPTMAWNYPRFDGDELPTNPNAGGKYSFNPQGFVFTMAGSLDGEEGFVDGIGNDARFRHPEGVAVDNEGYVYIADTGNHAIRMISPTGHVSTIAGGTGFHGSKDGLATEGAQFSSPTDIAVWRDWAWWPYPNPIDPDSFLYSNGNGTLALFIADTANHRIRKVTGDVEVNNPDSDEEKLWHNVKVECFAGRCGNNPEPGFADGKKDMARFDSPLGLTVSHEGNVYVADTNNGLIRKIDQFGTVSTIAGFDEQYRSNYHGLKQTMDHFGTMPTIVGLDDQFRFNYPSDVALSSNEDAIIVTDRHRIHSVNLTDGSITTLAGGKHEGSRDGDGVDSTFNNPTSITITGDGVAFVSDSASCRRVSSTATVAQKILCTDSLASIMRPNGCSSYNFPIDEYGLATSPIEGNIHYNYQFRDEFDIDLGHDFIGRSQKNCVGSPPTSALDKKRWNETISLYPFNYNLVIDDNATHISENPNDGTRIIVECSENCSAEEALSTVSSYTVTISDIGLTHVYPEDTQVCRAALNEDILDESGRGIIDVTIISEDRLRDQIDTAGKHQFFVVSKSSQDVRIQTIGGAPTSLQGRFCGQRDSFSPQNSMFYHPSGLGAYVNATLNDASHLMYIADRDNHVIRGMSAVCSFRCENSGLCVGPDQCECAQGWTGIDCAQPICQSSCGQRELCVAPDTCDCIPGYRGEGCLEATCAQQCVNGHCSAPDSCACDPGWFDSNCTTPVCVQTCGNGGNCTGANTCTCPSDWTGLDCRTPVCEQDCSNGGSCVAPNTCQCSPDYSGYDCSLPVCHQGFFMSIHELPEWMIEPTRKRHWLEYQPCNLTSWCDETKGFDCAQKYRGILPATPQFGMNGRYTPNLPYDWLSNERLPWNAFDRPEAHLTQPYKYQIDRQVALASYINVTQGAYMCANGGECVAPDVCSCAKGWIGFDCRVPVCEQGYYEPTLGAFAKGVKSDEDLATFEPFLDVRRTYDLDSTRSFASNPDIEVWVEKFVNDTTVQRELIAVNGSQYLAGNESQFQGGYECSIRSVNEWEDYRSGYVLEHPNYYSRYMDEKVEDDGMVYSHWKGMNFPPTHHKTAKLVKYDHEFLPDIQNNLISQQSFMYSDVGYMKDGVWKVTGAKWEKGICIIEFERHCDGSGPNKTSVVLVQDTDESFRPVITYDDNRTHITGGWFTSKDEVCVDHVVRGCYNNGTCVAPNSCQCAPGWTGFDCSIPVCEQPCLHNGNCTHPNTCTCERGWSSHDCSVAICAQDCNHGECVAPDTCKCHQWDNAWRDGRIGGGVPLFQKPNGDPQLTGYTGYDCNTPICVQAERFRLNIDNSKASLGDLVPLGGHGKDGALECKVARCPKYDEMVTQNDGRSFQSGCGNDVLDTGCCFELDSDDSSPSYHCFRCDELLVSDHNATCTPDELGEWKFESSSDVPLAFTYLGEIIKCGPSLNPNVLNSSELISTPKTSDMFLCNIWQWEQGDYIDDAGLQNEQGIGADFGLKPERHTRINYNNYQHSGEDNVWTTGSEMQGEGIFECYNRGSCISPDTCSCKDGYGGFDCATPLCRHEQVTGEIAGCVNGVCIAKDECQCTQQISVLWQVHKEAARGLTGWSGSDCSMPMCTQGNFDPDCNVSAAPGREGCYTCENGGICVAPDVCHCAEGWSGYDCKTPVCKAIATPLIREQLMTSDERKVRIFEEDPCGMIGFNTLRYEGPRGVCTLPNQCTCNCQGSYDYEKCRRIGGKHCQTPFHDPRFRVRNILPNNQIFGTRNCYSGYEGFVDENDLFSSCHMVIYEPTFYQRHTRGVIGLTSFTLIVLCIVMANLWVKVTRKKRQRQENSLLELERNEGNTNGPAFGYRAKKRD